MATIIRTAAMVEDAPKSAGQDIVVASDKEPTNAVPLQVADTVKISSSGSVGNNIGKAGGGRASANCGRLASLLSLTAVSILVLFADFLFFGRQADSGWFAELWTLVATGSSTEAAIGTWLVVLLSVKSVGPWWRTAPRSKSAAGTEGAGVQKVPRKGAENTIASRVDPNRSGCGTAPSKAISQAAARKATNTVVSKWNQAIDLAARHGEAEKAGQLLLEFEQSGEPESVSYNLVIRACARQGDADAAARWLRRMEARGVPATVCSYNTMLDACAKADRAEACEWWLQHMVDRGVVPNVISYATAIYARARRGEVEASAAWLHRMIDAGVQPDAVSYNSLIHACGVKGDTPGAEHWLEEMQARNLETSVATYTAVIGACAKCGDVARAERWLEHMILEGVVPNVITFSSVIDTCAKAGNLARAEYWHEKMLEHGVTPNAHSFSAVINACAKRGGPGSAEAAERWLDRAEEAGVVRDVVVYSSVIDACGKNGDAEGASRVFRRMQASGLKPHIVAYSALARPYAYRGDWVKVESIAQGMAVNGIKQNAYFVYAQLLAYAVSRPRQPQRAEACFRKAIKDGVDMNDHVFGVLVRSVGSLHCAELMAELCPGRELPSPPPQRRGHTQTGSSWRK